MFNLIDTFLELIICWLCFVSCLGHDDNGAPLIVIDKDISFRCDPQLADTIIGLSQELSNLLEAKIARRSQNQSIDLQQLQETLTKAVVDLIMGDQDI